MTREEYDALPSGGKYECPDCGSRQTQPRPGCNCPSVPYKLGTYTEHINRKHHVCNFPAGLPQWEET